MTLEFKDDPSKKATSRLKGLYHEEWAFVGPPVEALLLDERLLLKETRVFSSLCEPAVNIFRWQKQLLQDVVQLAISHHHHASPARAIAKLQHHGTTSLHLEIR